MNISKGEIAFEKSREEITPKLLLEAIRVLAGRKVKLQFCNYFGGNESYHRRYCGVVRYREARYSTGDKLFLSCLLDLVDPMNGTNGNELRYLEKPYPGSFWR